MLNDDVAAPPPAAADAASRSDPAMLAAAASELGDLEIAQDPLSASQRDSGAASKITGGLSPAERSVWSAGGKQAAGKPVAPSRPPVAPAATPVAAEAADAPRRALDVSFDIAVVSDYRQAGLSRSSGNPAIQGSIDVEFPGGWSAGAWGSSTDSKHSNFEFALYGAKEFEFGDTDLAFGVVAVIDHEEGRFDFGIAQASVSHPVGPFDVTFSVGYAWEQAHLGDQDNLRLALRGKSPIGTLFGLPLTLGASVGRTEGRFAPEGARLDWSASLTADIFGTDFGVSYIDNDLDDERGDPAWVFSIAHTF